MEYFGTGVTNARGVGMAYKGTYPCNLARNIQSLKNDKRLFSNGPNFTEEVVAPLFARQPFPKCQNGLDATKVLNGPKNFNRNDEFIYLRQYAKDPDSTKFSRFLMANKSAIVSISVSVAALGLAAYVGLRGTTWEHEMQNQIAQSLLEKRDLGDIS